MSNFYKRFRNEVESYHQQRGWTAILVYGGWYSLGASFFVGAWMLWQMTWPGPPPEAKEWEPGNWLAYNFSIIGLILLGGAVCFSIGGVLASIVLVYFARRAVWAWQVFGAGAGYVLFVMTSVWCWRLPLY